MSFYQLKSLFAKNKYQNSVYDPLLSKSPTVRHNRLIRAEDEVHSFKTKQNVCVKLALAFDTKILLSKMLNLIILISYSNKIALFQNKIILQMRLIVLEINPRIPIV